LDAAEDGPLTALALVRAPLSAGSIGIIQEWPELPLLAVAPPRQDDALRSAVDSYLASSNPFSDLIVADIDEDVIQGVAGWLMERLTTTTSIEEVTTTSSDGWELHGTLRLPQSDHAVPGVVLLHSARSDRAVYARLERLLAESGVAVLNLDWRGRGQSVSRGTLWTLSEAERAESWRDGLAGLEALASRPEVDGQRLGLLGSAQGAEIAVRAGMRDDRVRAVTILTGYQPDDAAEETFINAGTAEFLFVTSSDHRDRTEAMRRLYESSPGRRTRYIEYPGSALGYQLFDADPGLEPAIVAWFGEVLAR
jgi:dienelactone hydrolase